MRNRISVIICFFSFLIITGCNEEKSTELPAHIESKNLDNLAVYPLDQEKEYQIRLEQQQEFGDYEDVYIGNIVDAAADEFGRVYLADKRQSNIKVYNTEGSLIKKLGQPGQGPGDFQNIRDIQINNHQLYAYDDSQQRSVVFNLDNLEYSHTINLAENRNNYDDLRSSAMPAYFVMGDGSFFMKFSIFDYSAGRNDWDQAINKGSYYLLNKEGEIISDKFFEMKSFTSVFIPAEGRPTVDVPMNFLYGEALEALSPDNKFHLAWSQNLLIMTFDQDGEYQRSFYYPYEGVPLDEESIGQSGYSEALFFDNLDELNLPDRWPVIDSMIIDDENRFWLAVITEDKDNFEWLVLQGSGEFITSIDLPRDIKIMDIRNGHLYAHETDSETGLEKMIRYQIISQ